MQILSRSPSAGIGKGPAELASASCGLLNNCKAPHDALMFLGVSSQLCGRDRQENTHA